MPCPPTPSGSEASSDQPRRLSASSRWHAKGSSRLTSRHAPPPHIAGRRQHPPHVADGVASFGDRIMSAVTNAVGTLLCAVLFTALALVSLPQVIKAGDVVILVNWVAQTFLQLVLPAVILGGQAVQGRAADKRAVLTYQDAEAILHECVELQKHLSSQDEALAKALDRQAT